VFITSKCDVSVIFFSHNQKETVKSGTVLPVEEPHQKSALPVVVIIEGHLLGPTSRAATLQPDAA
jgi:hypothetical protein